MLGGDYDNDESSIMNAETIEQKDDTANLEGTAKNDPSKKTKKTIGHYSIGKRSIILTM